MTSNNRSSIRRAGREFLPAFKSTWPYVLTGLCVGFLLLALHHFLAKVYPQDEGVSATFGIGAVVHHLGVAFVVSAIAVFFYEWGSHERRTLELAARLAEIHSELGELRSAQAEKALERSLSVILGDDDEITSRFRSEIRELVVDIARLNRREHWARAGYLHCTLELLSALKGNVHSLSHLDDILADFPYRLAAAKNADAILAAQLGCLAQGDSYAAVSLLQSWVGNHLEHLHKESEQALGRNVQVRRLFNLLGDCAHLNRGMVEEILRRHARLAKLKTSYEVRVLRADQLSANMDPTDRQRLEGAQFAFFKRGDSCLRVDVQSPDLSRMCFSSDPSIYRDDYEMFEEAWGVAKVLDQAMVDLCLEQIYGNAVTAA